SILPHEHDRGDGGELEPDIFSTPRPSEAPKVKKCEAGVGNEYSWKDVEVIWELKRSENLINDEGHISALALKATEIMRVQWGRRFVIGIYACGAKWRLCWFDRAGAISHLPFNIKLD